MWFGRSFVVIRLFHVDFTYFFIVLLDDIFQVLNSAFKSSISGAAVEVVRKLSGIFRSFSLCSISGVGGHLSRRVFEKD